MHSVKLGEQLKNKQKVWLMEPRLAPEIYANPGQKPPKEADIFALG